jgi:LPXTG-site transpeptidase (sortase) family protein
MRRLFALLAVLLCGCTPWVGYCDETHPIRGSTQVDIDAGNVVNYTGCWPGDGCTIVLAGHRTTHGAPFANVPRLRPGDQIRLGYNGQIYTYTVESIRVVCCQGDPFTFHGVLNLVTSRNSRESYLVTAS